MLKVSVIITNYNYGRYIDRAIRSVLTQSLSSDKFEVIVIDDRSSDDSRERIANYRTSIKAIILDENVGLSAARNIGIENAKGKYITFIDADDYVNHDFLYITSCFLDWNEAWGSVAVDYLQVDNEENVIARKSAEQVPIACGIVYRKSVFIKCGLFDANLRMHEDVDFRIRYAKNYGMHYIHIPMYRYRKHGNSMTDQTDLSVEYMCKLEEKHKYPSWYDNYLNIDNRPYLVAEAGVNHEGDMDLAVRMIHEAAQAGADAIKFQAYKADKLSIKNSPGYWDFNEEPCQTQYKLFNKYDSFNQEDYEKLSIECRKASIDFVSTPFDFESADFLAPLMPFFKISSSDITNHPFIRYICRYQKPVVLSTGAATMEEISAAVEIIKNSGNDLILLHCVLSYPTRAQEANLKRIQTLKNTFADFEIGYSDHTLPEDMSTLHMAWSLGAKFLEKHFTYDKNKKGNDHYHSMNDSDIYVFLKKAGEKLPMHAIECDLRYGDGMLNPKENEFDARLYARRSIVINKNVSRGKTITPDDLTFKRPAHGIPPSSLTAIIGAKYATGLRADHVLTWNDIKYI